MARARILIAIVLLTLGGCSLTTEDCNDNEEVCFDDCPAGSERDACFMICAEEHDECLAGVENDGDGVRATLEILDALFGDDDDC